MLQQIRDERVAAEHAWINANRCRADAETAKDASQAAQVAAEAARAAAESLLASLATATPSDEELDRPLQLLALGESMSQRGRSRITIHSIGLSADCPVL